MNILKKAGFRMYQGVLFVAQRFIGYKEPELASAENASYQVGEFLKKKGYKKPLLVADPTLYNLGLVNNLIKGVEDANLPYALYTHVKPNPTITNVEDGLKVYLENGCDCLVALGGGSTIDCAKMIGARKVNPKRSVEQMKGVLKVRKKTPYFIAIPTTAGSGSECTLAAVIVNEETLDKYAINDPHITPKATFHDPYLLVKLPGKVTSTTGMDALTHAVEAYIGRSNTKKTKRCALEAIKLIFDNLENAYNHPEDLVARKNMQKASYLAGVAFTNAYVGYVHALAHSLGGKFDTPHGLANAVLLPNVLEAFGTSIDKKAAKIVDYLELADKSLSNHEKCELFISKIREMNKNMNIPEKLEIPMDDKTLDELVNHSYKEANPLYPVPKILDKNELKAIYIKTLVR